MTTENKLKSLLCDLGKATLRGVKKCPKCGTVNGTRGLSCKNKSCGEIFRESSYKKRLQDACRLDCGKDSSALILYSVRTRPRGIDYRGFVQLRSVNEDHTTHIAHCYVEDCSYNKEISREGVAHQLNPCPHVTAAASSSKLSRALKISQDVAESLDISYEAKSICYMMDVEGGCPLVQRVSPFTMVVKCKDSQEAPLGFVHCSLFDQKYIPNKEEGWTVSCSCGSVVQKLYYMEKKKCIHFYLCMVAFASDDALSSEFASFLEVVEPIHPMPLESIILNNFHPGNSKDHQSKEGMRLEMVSDDAIILAASQSGISLNEDAVVQLRESDISLTLGNLEAPLLEPGKRRSDELPDVPLPKKSQSSSSISHLPRNAPEVHLDSQEDHPVVGFLNWLSGVTEAVNLSMNYGLPGTQSSLTFMVSESFFHALRERVCSGLMQKQKLNPDIQEYSRASHPPMGRFIKYIWSITNVLHLRRIFDTPKVALQVSQTWIQNDKESGVFVPRGAQEDNATSFPGYRPICSNQCRTFLKIGIISPDQKEPLEFQIMWTPNLYPQSGMGELELHFKFGHMHNGRVVQPNSEPPHIVIPALSRVQKHT